MTLVGAGALGAILSAPMPRCGRSGRSSSTTGRRPSGSACGRTRAGTGFEAIGHRPILQRPSGQSDIVSCVTTSTAPIVKGAWLKPGTHVDLAGAFKPAMRETDGEVVARARVYVDTRDGALAEAGDLLQARDEGKLRFRQRPGRSLRPLPGQGEGPRRRLRKSPCSSPAAPPSRTLPPPSWCICAT